MLRRTLTLVAALTIAVATAGTAVATVHTSTSRSLDSMDMDMDHGHGNSKGAHGKSSPTVAGAREIAVRARSFKFTPNQITMNAGENVTIALHSVDVLHDFVVKGEGHIVSAKAHKTTKGGLMIDTAGTYKFRCSVSGHRKAGMRGTIVVT